MGEHARASRKLPLATDQPPEETTVSYKTYINLPVENLDASKAFFEKLGFGRPIRMAGNAAGLKTNSACRGKSSLQS